MPPDNLKDQLSLSLHRSMQHFVTFVEAVIAASLSDVALAEEVTASSVSHNNVVGTGGHPSQVLGRRPIVPEVSKG